MQAGPIGERVLLTANGIGPMKFAYDDNEYLHIMTTNRMRRRDSRWTNESCS
ncbi:hypothetical protein T07_1319 [Trichinella nelsoni]|uniref:Uncharacterized protein n=1 Tax=Trichinella nelsoni TaxID=6336 RepID=A0A0V0RAV7_9BILA|nr:hypothetical protein T07_1319 [Trichinella nelsoni]